VSITKVPVMIGDLRRLGGLLAVAIVAGGCGAGKKAVKDGTPPSTRATPPSAEPSHPQLREGERLSEHDLNGDQKADVWIFTVLRKDASGQDVDVLVRKELDINWDGKVDITRSYDDRGVLEREALDLNFDGAADQTNFYEAGNLVRKEHDLDFDGRTDQRNFFERGKLVRKERDTNLDGKIDYWEYWEGDQVDRVGEDLDGDGQVDRWTKNSASSAQG
jgi:hypothetical protein